MHTIVCTFTQNEDLTLENASLKGSLQEQLNRSKELQYALDGQSFIYLSIQPSFHPSI